MINGSSQWSPELVREGGTLLSHTAGYGALKLGRLHEMRGKDEGEGRLAGKEVNENYVCGPEFCFIWFCFI